MDSLNPRAWQDPPRVADRLLRVVPAAGAAVPGDVAAWLWRLRGGGRDLRSSVPTTEA